MGTRNQISTKPFKNEHFKLAVCNKQAQNQPTFVRRKATPTVPPLRTSNTCITKSREHQTIHFIYTKQIEFCLQIYIAKPN